MRVSEFFGSPWPFLLILACFTIYTAVLVAIPKVKHRVDSFLTTRSVKTFDVQHTVMTRLADYKPITYDGINFRAICPVCKEWGIYGRINLRRTAFNATCPSCCDTEADKGLSTIFDNTMTRLMKQ